MQTLLLSSSPAVRFFPDFVVCNEFAILASHKTFATHTHYFAHGRNRQSFVLMTLDVIKVNFIFVGHHEPIAAETLQFANFSCQTGHFFAPLVENAVLVAIILYGGDGFYTICRFFQSSTTQKQHNSKYRGEHSLYCKTFHNSYISGGKNNENNG